MNQLKLYKHFILVYLKCKLEYRISFFMYIITPMISYLCNYIVIWLLVNKFESIGGWEIYELMFLYSINLLSYGLSGLFVFTPMRTLDSMIVEGHFDMILIKPLNPLLHLIYRQFNYMFLAHVILSTVAIVFISIKLNIIFNILTIFLLFLMLIGATLIQSSLMIITGSMSFWFLNSSSVIMSVINLVRTLIDYPISIYNKFIQIILTFFLPYSFISFYPARMFLNKSDSGYFDYRLAYATPIVGVIMMLLAIKVWNKGMKNYQGTGS